MLAVVVISNNFNNFHFHYEKSNNYNQIIDLGIHNINNKGKVMKQTMDQWVPEEDYLPVLRIWIDKLNKISNQNLIK